MMASPARQLSAWCQEFGDFLRVAIEPAENVLCCEWIPGPQRKRSVMAVSQSTRLTQAHFDEAAAVYDQAFTRTAIGGAERDAVWGELKRVFHRGQRILELNCGTGVDAAYLAERGVKVLACDIAPRMIEVARQRLSRTSVQDLVHFRVLATEEIGSLMGEDPFDGAFSNFGGLNCVEDLSAVARRLAEILKPGGQALLCIAGRFVPAEIVWHLAHGSARNAMRRLRPGRGNHQIRVYYPSARAVSRLFAPQFALRSWRGIGVTLPPAYLEPWARRYPKLLHRLARVDRLLGRVPLLRGMAGHVLLQFERLGT
jgi:ubiquinone/menaquinone biosynthesis C-methylase UbiE